MIEKVSFLQAVQDFTHGRQGLQGGIVTKKVLKFQSRITIYQPGPEIGLICLKYNHKAPADLYPFHLPA